MIAPVHALYQNEATGVGTQKCNSCFGAKSPLRSAGLQNARLHSAPYWADSEDFTKFGASFNNSTVIVPMHLLYQKEATEWRTQKCNPLFGAKSPLRSTGLQNIRFHAAPYTADSADFQKFGAYFNNGTVIAPMHLLYQKEATEWRTQKCNPSFG